MLAGKANEGVKVTPIDGLRASQAASLSVPDTRPCRPYVGDFIGEWRRIHLRLKLRHDIGTTLADCAV